ncbi:hypothetical protein B6U96_14770 [Archaeoglobales archaeon ex4484_92]|nr:MAG: hypothetical protein B6U96_14770 [Archaeoglobales archaeon ex4484_92]
MENPKFYEKTLDRLRIGQRRLSKKKKGSKNYEKQRRKLAKKYEKLVNQRACRILMRGWDGPDSLLETSTQNNLL